MSERLSVSIAQMEIFAGEPQRNLEQMRALSAEAARRGSQLVVFPELWASGYALERSQELADELEEGLFAEVAAIARREGLHITGSLLERRGDKVCNSAAWFTPGGQLAGVYRKIHLFRLFDEHVWLAPGEAPLAMPMPWGRTALAICYDLRFPELFRRYALEGARLIILPAEWPRARVAHWRTLLRARAIENQCALVACNAVGMAGETRIGGHSMAIDAWGEVLVEGGEEAMLLTTDLDLAGVDEVRSRIPVFADRRPALYESLPPA